MYLSLALPGDEKAILVHFHLTVGLKDVWVLQRERNIFYKRGLHQSQDFI